MSFFIFRSCRILLLGILFCVVGISYGEAAEIVRGTTDSFLEVHAGEEVEVIIEVKNLTATQQVLGIGYKTIIGNDGYGQRQLVLPRREHRWEPANWGKQEQREVVLGANGLVERRISFVIPEDTPAGSYTVAVVLYSLQERTRDVEILPVTFVVDTEIKEVIEVEQFEVDREALRVGGSLRFRIALHNTGTVPVFPRGKVFLQKDGVDLYGVSTLQREDGTSEVIDYLDVTLGRHALLPDERRVVFIPWQHAVVHGLISASYELVGTITTPPKTGETSILLTQDIRIRSFWYDSAQQAFVVVLENRGNVPMPYYGQVHVYSDEKTEPLVTLSTGGESFIEVGVTETIVFPWRDEQSGMGMYGVFSYLVDGRTGETLTRKIILGEEIRAQAEKLPWVLYGGVGVSSGILIVILWRVGRRLRVS